MQDLLSALPPPGRAALFLDFDGTLVDIADHPERVHVPAELPQLLDRIGEATGGALALVSGRPVDEIDRLLRHPIATVVGEHGLDRRDPDGTRFERAPPPGLREAARAMEAAVAPHRGAWVERKRGSVAVHYRAAPNAGPELRRAAAEAAARADPPLHVLEGKMVVELKAADRNKGVAIAELVALPRFAGRVPAFAGDDVTDEDAFAVINRLGGISVLVGNRETLARHRVPSTGALRALLLAWLDRRAA